jgi:hypothetical protein
MGRRSLIAPSLLIGASLRTATQRVRPIETVDSHNGTGLSAATRATRGKPRLVQKKIAKSLSRLWPPLELPPIVPRRIPRC